MDVILFWQNIRSFIQQDAGGKMAICIVGTSPLLLETAKIKNVANPMYLFSQKKFIQPFSFNDSKDMIDRLGFFMGMEFDATQIARLQELYGGHPFFIRQVCSIAHQISSTNRPIKISTRILDEAIQKFGGQLESYLSDILDNLKEFYPDEFELLKAVTAGDNDEITEFGREGPELIDHLIGYGIIERRGEEYDLRFEAVRSALQSIFGSSSSVDEFWTEMTLRRNHIETDIRRELLYFSKGVDPDSWIEILSSNLSKSRFNGLASLEPRVLFSRSDSPLYWSDLISLIRTEAVLPHLGESRRSILGALNLVNTKGRKDSHAKHPSAQDMKEVRKAFDTLESEFSQPE